VPSAYTIRIIDKGGEIKTLHAVVALIPGTKQSIASFVDISEQKRSEDALTQMNRKLNLLSSITRHDIINQLMVLKGFLALLKQKAGDSSLSDYVERSERATLNIEHQIIFTRDYQDMGVKAPVWQNLKSTVIAAKGALNLESVTFEMNMPDIEVYADRLFEKVFFNLIDNSLKYGGPGLSTIRISAEQCDDVVVITYQDNGEGIPDKDREHLFERGFGKHTGFGLFLSREILSITRISIEETGSEGTGAQFTIRVPKGTFRLATE
jgi:signal transduction histidine kinase